MNRNTRAGFTLVELMVAMALTMFIMVILSQAFVISLDTFAAMKGLGDMQEKLRSASVILRDDLRHGHFEGNLKLSDVGVNRKPQAGFFAILQGTAPASNANAATAIPGGYVLEGSDPDAMRSYRATNQVLYMTVKRKGNQPQDFFTASLTNSAAVNAFFTNQTAYTMNQNADLPSATFTDPYSAAATVFYSSQWAEVIYYLERTGSTEEPNNPSDPPLGIPTYSLMRAQFVMVPDGTNVSGKIASANTANFQTLSCNPNGPNIAFYSPADASTGNRVVPSLGALVSGQTIAIPGRVSVAKTLVVPNVTSFHIQVMPTGASAFGDIPSAVVGSRVYDTTGFGVAGYPASATVGLRGVQITIRVFEPKTRQTRQLTIVQDM